MIFIDTGAFVGLHDPGDEFHEDAVKAWPALEGIPVKLITSDIVVVEAVTLIGRALGADAAVEFGRMVLASKSISVIRRTVADDLDGLHEMERYRDQDVGLADCVSFVLMRQEKAKAAFTFDRRHFSMGGFELYPPTLLDE